MLKELFDAVVSKGVQAVQPTFVQAPNEPPHVYYLCRPGVDPVLRTADAAPRNHTALSLNAVVEYVKQAGQDGTAAVVWYSSKSVVLLTDDMTRRDKVTLPLTISKPLATLAHLETAGTPFKLAAFREILRVTFADCLSRVQNLLTIIERVKFTQAAEQTAQIRHGATSVGKSLTEEMTGTGAVPEYVEFDVPVFVGEFGHLRGVVRCAVEPDPSTQTFRILPLPGEVSKAIRNAEEQIRVTLTELLPEGVPVLHGTP